MNKLKILSVYILLLMNSALVNTGKLKEKEIDTCTKKDVIKLVNFAMEYTTMNVYDITITETLHRKIHYKNVFSLLKIIEEDFTLPVFEGEITVFINLLPKDNKANGFVLLSMYQYTNTESDDSSKNVQWYQIGLPSSPDSSSKIRCSRTVLRFPNLGNQDSLTKCTRTELKGLDGKIFICPKMEITNIDENQYTFKLKLYLHGQTQDEKEEDAALHKKKKDEKKKKEREEEEDHEKKKGGKEGEDKDNKEEKEKESHRKDGHKNKADEGEIDGNSSKDNKEKSSGDKKKKEDDKEDTAEAHDKHKKTEGPVIFEMGEKVFKFNVV